MRSRLGAIRGPIARKVSGVISLSLKTRELVEGDARRADQRPKFVFHRLIGRQYDEPDRGARGEAVVERGRQNAEVDRAPGSYVLLGGRE